MKGLGKPERITRQLQLQCETKQLHIKQKNNNQTATTQKTQYKENKQEQMRNINKDTYRPFDGSHVKHVDACKNKHALQAQGCRGKVFGDSFTVGCQQHWIIPPVGASHVRQVCWVGRETCCCLTSEC